MLAEILLLAAATLVGVIVQTIAGFGFVFFLSPALLVYFSPPAAITITLLVASILSLLVLFGERRKPEFSWPIVITLLISATPGLILGGVIVTTVKKALLQLVVGVLVIIASIVQQYLLPKPKGFIKVSPGAVIAGFFGGILNTSTSMSAPALVIWLRSHTVGRNHIRDVLATTFLGLNFLGITTIYLFKHSALSLHGVEVFLWLSPLVIVGHQVGSHLVKKIDSEQYRELIIIAVVAAGLASIGLGLAHL